MKMFLELQLSEELCCVVVDALRSQERLELVSITMIEVEPFNNDVFNHMRMCQSRLTDIRYVIGSATLADSVNGKQKCLIQSEYQLLVMKNIILRQIKKVVADIVTHRDITDQTSMKQVERLELQLTELFEVASKLSNVA